MAILLILNLFFYLFVIDFTENIKYLENVKKYPWFYFKNYKRKYSTAAINRL